jgi:spore germination protein GerM
MRNNEKVFLVFVAVAMVAVCVFVGFKMFTPQEVVEVVETVEIPQVAVPVEPEKPTEVKKEYVNVFFIGQNDNREEVYKAVKREYDKEVDGSKIKFALNSLILGAKPNEKDKGVYSEIPAGTRVLAITEQPDKVIINLNSAFETGGGTDSVYKRIYQIIKTAKVNTTKPVYLYIDGKKAEVIGGDGIMLNQPLNDRSLN